MLWWRLVQLKSLNWKTRREVVEELGDMGDARAIKQLVLMLKDREDHVRSATWAALEKIDPTWAKSEGTQAAVPRLIVALKKKWFVRRVAERLLKKIEDTFDWGPPNDRNVRSLAAETLGMIGDVRAINSLIVALKDEDKDVRCSAAEALGMIGDVRAVDPLIIALKDEDKDVRCSAAKVMGMIGDKRAIEPLIAALKDMREIVREAAAEALGKIRDVQALKPLMAGLEDDTYAVRAEAVNALRLVIECNAAHITSDELHAIATLSYVLRTYEQRSECFPTRTTYVGVDCSQVKQLARQELIRRGLEA